MSPELIGFLGILLTLGLLMFFAFKGYSIILLAPILAVVASWINGGMPLADFTSVYMSKLGAYVAANFPVFLMGAVMGKMMYKSGCAQGIAEWISKTMPTKYAILSILIINTILTYGGVSIFVIVFTTYPIAVSIAKAANCPRRLILPAIIIPGFTFASYCLPGSPQIGNTLFMAPYGTTAWAAPVLGIILGVLEFMVSAFWLTRRQAKAKEKGEGFGEMKGNVNLSERFEYIPSFLVSVSPIILFMALNLIFPVVFEAIDPAALEPYGVTLAAVKGTWSLVLALLVASLFCILVGKKNFNGKGKAISTLGEGARDAVIPIINTGSVVGYGNVVATLVGYTYIQNAVMGIADNPLVAQMVAMNVLAGITGSASGGISIVLTTMGAQFLEMAKARGISAGVLHRIGSTASSGLDSLPHNGAYMSALSVADLTHKETYLDIFVCTVLTPLATATIGIILVMLGLNT